MDELNAALYQAYVGEAKAALRLKVFADKAEKEGTKVFPDNIIIDYFRFQ